MVELDERFRGKDWFRLLPDFRVKFKLKTYEDIVGQEQYQLWDNKARRFMHQAPDGSAINQYTKGRSFRCVREVIIDGKEVNFSIPKTANDQLKQILDTLRATNQDPLKVEFEAFKTGSGLNTRWSISLAGAGHSGSENPQPKEDGIYESEKK